MEELDTPEEVNQIRTFVFLDLESTGLPTSKPRITELSFIAVSRTHLLQMTESAVNGFTPTIENGHPSTHQAPATPSGSTLTPAVEQPKRKVIPKLPRVLHIYTKLYYPWKLIHPSAEATAGLSNEALEHLPDFSETSAQSLNFFIDFPKPVALVSHNGNRFDFPLLMAELSRVNCADKFVELYCVDTLPAIRDIDYLIEKEDITEITKLADSFNIEDFDDELSENTFSPSKRSRIGESTGTGDSPVPTTPPRPHESGSPGQGNNHHTLKVTPQPLMTPIKSHLQGQTTTPTTPSKPTQPPNLPYTPESTHLATPGYRSKATKESSRVRRTLTYDNKDRRGGKQLSYSQPNIFRRLFDTDYNAHRAEEDCRALLTICGHYGSKFVEWADTFATSFAKVKPMWVQRKAFNASQEG